MISSISEVDMDFTVDIYFRLRWKDERLAFSEMNETLNLGAGRVDQLWFPGVYFPKLKGGYRHELTIPNVMLRLSPDGSVFFSQRLALVVACSMELQHFPLDEQTCRLDFMPYGHTMEEVMLSWDKSSNFSLNPDIKLPDFELADVGIGNCTETFSTGTYSCLFADLKFRRQFGFFLTGTYLPTLLIIVLSWVGFWIDYRSTPSRVSLGLLTVLAVTTQITSNHSDLPRVSYVKAIDIWLVISMVFVAAALIEFAAVSVIARRAVDGNRVRNGDGNDGPADDKRLSTSSTRELVPRSVTKEKESQPPLTCFKSSASGDPARGFPQQNSALFVDKASRVIFPVIFVITTTIYVLWLRRSPAKSS